MRSFAAGVAAAAVVGAAAAAIWHPCCPVGARACPSPAVTAEAPAEAPSALPSRVPSPVEAMGAPVAALTSGGRELGPPRPAMTIDQAPEDPPPPGVDVTYAPSPNPPPLAPAESETEIWNAFKTPEEKAAFEERERRAWEEKKARELDLIVDLLTRDLSLSAMQTQRVRGILEDESRRRIEIVTALTEGRISQAEFRDRVDASLALGRRELAALLSPQQYAKYQTMEPRRQALNDKTITGH